MSLRMLQARAFGITFVGYAALHLVRRSLSVVKPDLVRFRYFGGSAEYTTHALALMDTLFLATYAVGLFMAGPVGDRVNRRVALFAVSWLTSASALLFALFGWLGVAATWPFVAIWALSGLVQSGGWPLSVSIVGQWFPTSSRGTVLGVWSSNAAVGNILGAVSVAAVLQHLDHRYHAWMAAMALVALPLLASGLLLLFLPNDPAHEGYPGLAREPEWMPEPTSPVAPPTHLLGGGVGSGCDKAVASPRGADAEGGRVRVEDAERATLLADAADGGDGPDAAPALAPAVGAAQGPGVSLAGGGPLPEGNAIEFSAAWLIPGVPTYAACYGCVKMVQYALMNWLALLIAKRFSVSASLAGSLSSLVDLGMIVGGVAGGYASDSLLGGRRALVSCGMLLAAVVALLALVRATAWSLPWLSFAVGFWLGGPSTLVNGAVAADLGTDPKLKGNTRALSTVVGIIDGVGSVGAALGQAVVGLIVAQPDSWTNVLTLVMAVTSVAALLLMQRSAEEVQSMRAKADSPVA